MIGGSVMCQQLITVDQGQLAGIASSRKITRRPSRETVVKAHRRQPQEWQPAVTAYLKSGQLPLFAIALLGSACTGYQMEHTVVTMPAMPTIAAAPFIFDI